MTFTLIERFFIHGTQTMPPLLPLSRNPSEGCPIDILGPGTSDIPSLQAHLTENQFTRVIWWPQEGLDRISVWKAKQTPSEEEWTIKEYDELLRNSLQELYFKHSTSLRETILLINPLAALLLRSFSPVTQGGEDGVQKFYDCWWRALPMVNEISDTIMPASFTELWFPLNQTEEIMNELNGLFKKHFTAVGNFFTEVYAAKESPFWMSPSYGGDKVRVDTTWFTANKAGDPANFFKPYWSTFEKRGYRCHWGKYTPEEYGERVESRYQKYSEWMKVREKMDPKQVSTFVHN